MIEYDPAIPDARCPRCLQPLPDPEHDEIGFCTLCGGLESDWVATKKLLLPEVRNL